MAFRGVFDHTLDSKNRLTVPRPYRNAFAQGVVLAIPPDGQPCVWVARPEEYEAYTASALAELSPLSAKRLELERFFFGNSHDAELDARERVMLPASMIEHAGLTKDVVVVGAGARLECWDRGAWTEYRPSLLSGAGEVTANAGPVN